MQDGGVKDIAVMQMPGGYAEAGGEVRNFQEINCGSVIHARDCGILIIRKE